MCVDVGSYLGPLEREMRSLLDRGDSRHAYLYDMMGYHLGWLDEDLHPVEAGGGGKRIRPLFCLFAAEAAGGSWERALPAATAVEILHNFSLVHDDIQDGSETRRHRPTVWRLWGEAQAINVGDALFALGYLALQRLGSRGVALETVNRATESLSETCLALCQGQYLDLRFEDLQEVSEGDYLAMVRGKTAALIGYSTYVGALVGSGDARTAQSYRGFGEEIGMAFQMVDDLLGIWGKEEVTGKPAADDIRSRKKTLPIVYAMDQAPERAKAELMEIFQKSQLTEEDLAAVMKILEDVGAEPYVREKAVECRGRALRALDRMGIRGAAQERLRELALLMVDREY